MSDAKPRKAREKKAVVLQSLLDGGLWGDEGVYPSTTEALMWCSERGGNGLTYRIVTVHREVKVEEVVTKKRRLV